MIVVLALALLAQDSSGVALRRRVWDEMSALERAEQHLTTQRPRPQDTTVARRLAAVRVDLDSMVFGTTGGPAELEQLRLAFPGSALLARYAARLDERAGRLEAALAEVERLIWREPADLELQRARARLLVATNRPREALDAYARALDLAPEDDSTFRALQALSEGLGTLDALLEQIRRLRIRLPASRTLADHETEVSQRLGVIR